MGDEPLFRAGHHMHAPEEVRAIRRHLRWLWWPGGRVRHIAEQVLEDPGRPLLAEEMAALRESLSRPAALNWHERVVAAWVLSRAGLTPEQAQEAAATLAAVLVRQTRHAVGVACGLGCFLPWVAFPLAAFWALTDGRLNRVRAACALALGQLRLPETIGHVASALFDAPGLRRTGGSVRVRRAAEWALPLLSAALGPEHYGGLPAETVPLLCRAVLHEKREVALAAVEALRVAGDGRAVDPLRRVRKWQVHTSVWRAVQDALPVLVERQARERAAELLLRPAESLPGQTDLLLRPAAGGGPVDAELLLRPHQGTEEP